MTGGSVTSTTAGATLALNNDVTATSDATGAATISMPGGILDLQALTRNFTVNDGPAASDLIISTAVNSGAAGGIGLAKSGSGRLELASGATVAQLASVTAGDLQVDAGATTTNLIVNGAAASVSGSGTIGKLSGSPSPTAAVVGTVNPGNNAVAPAVGSLTSSDVVWGASTSYFVDLTAAAGNDVLHVNGNLTLGGATLTGFSDPAIALNQQFTILTYTGTLTGKFFEPVSPNTVFISGRKFAVDYTSTPGSVILTRVVNQLTSFTVTSSKNASNYGENVVFTATAVPELGAGPLPSGLVVDFSLDSGPIVTVSVNPLTGIALFDPQTLSNTSWSVGTHTVNANFRDTNLPPVYANRTLAPTFQQIVNLAPMSLPVTSNPVVSPTSPVFGQSVTIFANAAPTTPPVSPNAAAPGGTVTFTLDGGGGSMTTTVPVAGAQWVIPSSLLPAGTHHVFVVYNGDSHYAATTPPVDLTVTIQKDTTVVNVTPPASTNLGQTATFNVSVTPGSGAPTTPTGTLRFYDGSTTNPPLGTVSYTGGTVPLSTATLSVGSHTIFFVFTDSTGNFISNSTSVPFNVNKAPTATTFVSAVPAAPTFGQPVNFTFRVVANPDISSVFPTFAPDGLVSLYDGVVSGATLLGSAAVNPLTNLVTITTTTTALAGGTHNIIAQYNGSPLFQPSMVTQSGLWPRPRQAILVAANPSVSVLVNRSPSPRR